MLQRRKILAQALNRGYGTDTIPADSGGTLVGDKIGLHTFVANTVNLDDFGAVGDGVTDDSVALATAIATGSNILTSAGKTYKTTAGISFPFANQIIDFNGSTLKPTGTFSAYLLAANGVTIRNLTVDASGLAGTVFFNAVPLQQLFFQNVKINNAGAFEAMVWTDIYLSWFQNVRFDTCGSTAFHLASGPAGTPVNSIYLDDCAFITGTATSGAAVLLEGVNACWLMGCNWQENASGSTDLMIRSNGIAGVDGITIHSCFFRDPTTDLNGNSVYIGDPLIGTSNQNNIVITNCFFQTSKQNVKIGLYSNNVTIADTAFMFISGSPTTPVLAVGSDYPRVVRCAGTFNSTPNWGQVTMNNDPNGFGPSSVDDPPLRIVGEANPFVAGTQSIMLGPEFNDSYSESMALTSDRLAGIGTTWGK